MNIEYVEVQNFRKLKSVRIEFTKSTTVLVGANNSGKTSAMVALGHFLVDHKRFSTNDFTLSNWEKINSIGTRWESASGVPDFSEWEDLLPSLDVWLRAADDEVHYVNHLVPTLSWTGGLLGVRMRLEPSKLVDLYKDYTTAVAAAKHTKAEAAKTKGSEHVVTLWPTNLEDFLQSRLRQHFEVRGYSLDPAKQALPKSGIAKPQTLIPGTEPLEGAPLKGLVRIDEINAQRGFGDATHKHDSNTADGHENDVRPERRRLSAQLKSYYDKHLNPLEHPDPADLDALEAIGKAQSAFDDKLQTGFFSAINEVQDLGYPGITDPKLIVATKLRPTDGLNHDAAVQYEVISNITGMRALRLPEDYNGLGYQNLISMIFKLMSFRDAWMRVGKAGKRVSAEDETFPPPLHLILVEEPEAHLHAQVQQVFIRKAYDVLRKHAQLGAAEQFRTQLIISTHSNHIAHECEFAWLRYFRRLPAQAPGSVPTSAVVNLSEVFGPVTETQKFVTRYLKATHCDLFFADAAILIEGPAERMLVPHFIQNHFPYLNQRYITMLEINGSHAHRLRDLIEHLGLTTLVITDLDAAAAAGAHPAALPSRGTAQITRNSTLKTWVPAKESLDELLDLPTAQKTKPNDPFSSVHVSYQTPIKVELRGVAGQEALPNTFEDALVFENLALFAGSTGSGLMKSFREAIVAATTAANLAAILFDLLKTGDKARFALDLIFEIEPKSLLVPTYIKEGLSWLEVQLRQRQLEVIAPAEKK